MDPNALLLAQAVLIGLALILASLLAWAFIDARTQEKIERIKADSAPRNPKDLP